MDLLQRIAGAPNRATRLEAALSFLSGLQLPQALKPVERIVHDLAEIDDPAERARRAHDADFNIRRLVAGYAQSEAATADYKARYQREQRRRRS